MPDASPEDGRPPEPWAPQGERVKIIVCVKQVPDTEAPIRIKTDGSGIDETALNLVMNYYDEHATEAGLRLREQFGGSVTLLSVGPERAQKALRTGPAIGGAAAHSIKYTAA